jgi:phage baseplate assembly protein W
MYEPRIKTDKIEVQTDEAVEGRVLILIIQYELPIET